MERKAQDPLTELLRRADVAAGSPPEVPVDFVLRVRRLSHRRRHFRRGVGAAVAAGIIATVVLSLVMSKDSRTRPHDETKLAGETVRKQDDEIAVLRAEIARTEAEVESRLTVVRHMLALEAAYQRRDELRRQLARLDIAEQIAREVDEAAFIIVYDADRQRKRQGGRASAIAAYRDVARLFPQTRWAKVAQDKLTEIEKL